MSVSDVTAIPASQAPPAGVASSDPHVAVPEQLSMARLLALFLVPGAVMTAAFVALAPVAEGLGLPPITALLAAIVAVLVPIEVGVVLWAARGTGSVLSVIPYRLGMPLRTWVWLVPTLVFAAFVGFGVHQVIEPQLIASLFGWMPGWFLTPIAVDTVRTYSAAVWAGTLAAFFVINGFVGPIVEEFYFRGYLLPRMEWMGRWAPLVNVTLFSLYHFWSPWQIVARILGFGPTVYAVRWKQNIYLGMAVHCSLNAIAVALVAMMVFSRL